MRGWDVRRDAADDGLQVFTVAASRAGLPVMPVIAAEILTEAEFDRRFDEPAVRRGILPDVDLDTAVVVVEDGTRITRAVAADMAELTLEQHRRATGDAG